MNTTITATITPDDMADAYKSARFDVWSGWVDDNAWAHGIAEAREHVAGDLLMEAGLTADEAREGRRAFDSVDALSALNVVCAYISDHAKTVDVDVDGDMDADALRLAEEFLEGVPTLELIDGAVREQLVSELPTVLAAIRQDEEF